MDPRDFHLGWRWRRDGSGGWAKKLLRSGEVWRSPWSWDRRDREGGHPRRKGRSTGRASPPEGGAARTPSPQARGAATGSGEAHSSKTRDICRSLVTYIERALRVYWCLMDRIASRNVSLYEPSRVGSVSLTKLNRTACCLSSTGPPSDSGIADLYPFKS